MTYTKDNPPVLKINFGSDAWPGIQGLNPPTVVIVDQSGVVQPVDTGAMVLIPGTPMWYYVVGDRITAGIPEASADWSYYVTAGPTGSVVSDGNIEISSNNVAVTEFTIASHRVIAPGAIQLPSSVSAPKIYPIKFVAYSASGDVLSLTSASITIGTSVLGAAMSQSGGVWQYDWTLIYSDTPAIHDITITATINGENTIFPATIETFKPKEFNPQRLSSGVVI